MSASPIGRRRLLQLGLIGLGAGLGPLQRQLRAATPPRQPELRFLAVADTGTGGRGQYAVARAMEAYRQRNPLNLVILGGDNIYNHGEMEKVEAVFEKPYAPLLKAGVRFRAVLGNHDIRTNNGIDHLLYPGFNYENGQRWYTFRQGPVQFFMLDTNRNVDWTRQLTWLEAELKASRSPWKIVVGHHPIYSSGIYGTDPGMVRRLTPLFQRYGVKLYINGHDHSYERTREINGTTYLCVGAGAGLRPVGTTAITAKSASILSFAALEVYPEEIRIQGISSDGKVFDQGVIRR